LVYIIGLKYTSIYSRALGLKYTWTIIEDFSYCGFYSFFTFTSKQTDFRLLFVCFFPVLLFKKMVNGTVYIIQDRCLARIYDVSEDLQLLIKQLLKNRGGDEKPRDKKVAQFF